MQKELAERFDDTVLEEAVERFGLDPARIRELPGFENRVYEVERDGRDHILRLAHSARRTVHATRGEVEWLAHLAEHGVPVAPAVRSRAGRRVEVLRPHPDGSYFVAVLFVRAEGEVLEDVPALKDRYWGPDLFRRWGAVAGRMHRVSVGWRESHPFHRRPHWWEYDVLDVRRFVPPDQHRVRERADELLARLHGFPRDDEIYGLIHADLTQLNFCVKDGEMTLIDFDNCERSWFVKDLAVSLYYVSGVARNGEPTPAEEFLVPFLEGYREEGEIDPRVVDAVPLFLRLQRVMNYTLAWQRSSPEELEKERGEELARTRRAIEEAEPVVELDPAWLRAG